jgi:hypothetical protein
MVKLDWKKDCKDLYFPPSKPAVIEVPPMNFLMIDGHGDPNHSPQYQAAIEALYSLSYTLKFAIKKAEGVDYTVFPPEGLWWIEDMSRFLQADKSEWDWTMMIAQPAPVTAEWVERAREEVLRKKGIETVRQVRFENYAEGLAAQVFYTGSYDFEGPTVAALHQLVAEQGGQLFGKHHEIYLSDARRTAPERLRTVIRQPFRRA